MALSVTQLLRRAWKDDVKRSQKVSVLRRSVTNTTKGLQITTVTRDKGSNRVHKQKVYAASGGSPAIPLSQLSGIKCSCDCPRFKFYYEYVLARHGAADIIYCDGTFPFNTNPRGRIGICKHLIKSLMYLLQTGR